MDWTPLTFVYKILYRDRARDCPSSRGHAQAKLYFECKIPLLARALGLNAARPSARATIGYLVYKVILPTTYTLANSYKEHVYFRFLRAKLYSNSIF